MKNRYWVDTGNHVYVDGEPRVDTEPEISCHHVDCCGFLTGYEPAEQASVEFAAAIIDATRGHKDPIGWFQDVALAERVCALLNAQDRLARILAPIRRRPRKRVLDGAAMR